MVYELACPVTADEADEIAEDLRALVDSTEGERVVVGCAAWRIDGDGVRMLTAVDRYARKAGHLLVLLDVPEADRPLIAAAGLTQHETS